MVVHGDDFIISGDGDDLDWLSQKLNEKLELVQKARLGPGYDNEATVLNRRVHTATLDLRGKPATCRALQWITWSSGGASTDEPRWCQATCATGP